MDLHFYEIGLWCISGDTSQHMLSIMQGAIWLFVHNVGGCVGGIANRGACVAAYVCAHTLSAVSALWV